MDERDPGAREALRQADVELQERGPRPLAKIGPTLGRAIDDKVGPLGDKALHRLRIGEIRLRVAWRAHRPPGLLEHLGDLRTQKPRSPGDKHSLHGTSA